MSTAPSAPPSAHPAPALTTPAAAPQEKYAVQHTVIGGITVLTMQGTLNEDFVGRKVAEMVRTNKVVVIMREVRRFASWGMAEWMDFLRINEERDLYLVECSTYAVSQVNLVTGLLGHAKLVSFYASYRCGGCSEEFESMFVIPRDRDVIRTLPGSHEECPTCGGVARLEEYPAAFFDTIADRPSFDIDDEVLALFRSQLRYDLSPDLARFRAVRSVREEFTYMRWSGSISNLPVASLLAASEGTTIVDVGGIIFDPDRLDAWREYVEAARAKLKSLQLLNCPPGFLEHAVVNEDLRDKVKIRTFALPHSCTRCELYSTQLVDVAENLEQLVGGTVPNARCPECKSLLVPILTPEQVALVRSLPARDRNAALERFLTEARREPPEKLENCLVARPQAKPRAKSGRGMYLAMALSTLLVGGLAVVGYGLWKQHGEESNRVAAVTDARPAVTPPPPPKYTRPDWITSDVPSSGYCHDAGNRLMCVGVSSYRATREEAVGEASDAALEELVIAVGLKISDPFVRDTVLPGYSGVRSSALQAAELERTSAADAPIVAAEVVRKARRRVVEILQRSGGAAAPTQRSDWYWEEYASERGGSEVLVFVRYDISLVAMRALVERYSSTTTVMGNKVMTAFPALGWPYDDFKGGAVLTKVSGPLARAGIAAPVIVAAVGEQAVTDAAAFAKRLEEAAASGSSVALTVKAGTDPAKVIQILRP